MEDDSVDAALDALWQELNAAEAAVAAFGPTPEQLRAEAAAAERLAKENGTPAKSAAVIKSLARRWTEFIDVHGDAYEYDAASGPTIELAIHFQVRSSACACACVGRLRRSCGRGERARAMLLRASVARAIRDGGAA